MSRGLRFELARVVLETDAPFSVGTGGGDDVRDAVFVRDANGLPAIPGRRWLGS